MGENKKVMKKVLSMILAVLTVSVLLAAAVSAAYYKTIPGNLIKGGDFNSADVADYFWMNPDEGPYRGGTCVWQKDGGAGNSGCIRMNGTDNVSSVPALVPRNLVDGVVDGKNVDAKMWPQVVEGKKYVAMIDVFRPVGVDATVQWDTENGLVAYQRAAKNGEWERIVTIWTANTSGNCHLRVVNECLDGGIGLKPDQYVLLDNFYFAEYKEGVNYTEMVNEETPDTGDNAVVISAVVAAAALAGVCVVAGKKKSR